MKKNKTIICVTLLILAATIVSCKLFGKTEVAENTNTGNTSNSDNVLTNTNSAADQPTPYPAANCPSETFSVFNLTDGKYDKYEDCTLTFRGKLLKLEDKFASIVDESERMELVRDEFEVRSRALSCSGDFSDNTSYQIGQKLEELKRLKQFGRLPTVTFKATVKTSGEYTSLTDCYMDGFQK